jgi:hypothetical protein
MDSLVKEKVGKGGPSARSYSSGFYTETSVAVAS